ncbi:hypothetical protein UPYG_G00006390 [Umbra pygmaea]|uniref:C2 domain-containing protein n=1 Tax=Umbra pygmaea TaxID=75934 RepID=A0ABD0XHJ3_UMBPY
MASCISLSVGLLFLCMLAGIHGATVKIWGLHARGLVGDPTTHPDAYVKVSCGTISGGMTEFRRDEDDPSWRSQFTLEGVKAGTPLTLEVWDKDLNFDDHLGTCTIPLTYGTHTNKSCYVRTGGTLYYSYTYSY